MDPDPLQIALPLLALATSFLSLKIGILIFLIVSSALISGAEVAFFGLSATDLHDLEKRSDAKANLVMRLLEKPKKLLATILIANNAINIGIVLLFSDLGNVFFSGITYVFFDLISLKFLIEVVLVTFLILMFGEILPKVYANRNRMAFAQFMSLPIKGLDLVFSPLSMPMRWVSLFLHEQLGKQRSTLSVDHLSQALELTSDGDTTKEEQKILEGIVSFGNTDTKQVMRPRIDIFALSDSLKFTEVLEAITTHGYSRIPVYSEHIDQVVGVLYVKDLLPYIDRKTFAWMSLIRPPYFVPENKKLDNLLLEFQDKKMHLAVVVDEFGGTSGIVTLEDIIEEIVGDISDEFDDEDLVYSKLDAHNFVFEGKTTLKDFYKVAKIEEEDLFESHKGESETIAGFVLEIAQGFPKRGSEIPFHNYKFTVESLDKKRLRQIKISLPKDS
ncbi:MAG: gliding motility-associated protein GldE [Flavobacteriia bacterium]|nr:gliding motility-associated protein GldE [Flavobacteriia bacterium]